ncbi:TetR/AcrR family transcriptional regulator [Thalassospira sp. MCCC 1A01428]|uniref:TetR/AcrR family transcriptional regulator n=1 Tax=Thalassospira sp. MCCC 1A01428 TaxID=1470575 RepID=UPI000A1EE736|nr:TetR/AcrR family transcriptional regulator [Thalassospira sp. MCCC 1A01428]
MKDKQTHLIDTAINLFARDGVSVSTARIASEAGVSNGTLFNYFPTKQQLIDSVYLSIKEDIARNVLPSLGQDMSVKEVMFGIWRGYIQWALANPLHHEVSILLKAAMVLSAATLERADAIFELKVAKLRKGVEQHQLVDLPVDYICELSTAQLSVAVAFLQRFKLDSVDASKHIHCSFDVFWNGINA